MECLSPYLCMVTVPHIMVGLERVLDYRGVRLARFHCISLGVYSDFTNSHSHTPITHIPCGDSQSSSYNYTNKYIL